MHNKLLLIILGIVVLVGLGLVFAKQTNAPKQETTQTNNANTETQNTQAAQVAPTTSSTQDTAIIGTWQSNEDAAYIISFTSDGKIIDRYDSRDNPVTTEGSYSIFTPQTAPAEITLSNDDPNAQFLSTVFADQTYYYQIIQVNNTSLELLYLDRGNMLSFTKIQ